MARNRYSLLQDGSGSGGGSSSSSGNLIVVKGRTGSADDFVKANLIQDKHTFNLMSDQNTSGPDQHFQWGWNNSRKPIITATRVGNLPAGITETINTQTTNEDEGYVRVYGTPTTNGTYNFSYTIPDPYTDISFTVNFKYIVAPSGTTPVWASTSVPTLIVNNAVAAQTIAAGPTTSYSGAVFTLSAISGVPTGVTLKINEATGEVYTDNTPNATTSAATMSFTVGVDLGEYGSITQVFSGSVLLGPPYGARYFGPANADVNIQGNADYSASVAASEARCNPAKSSGALRRYWDNSSDTSPYSYNDGYGCFWTSSMISYMTDAIADDVGVVSNLTDVSLYRKNGAMGINVSSNRFWCSGQNWQTAKFKWQVPTGVTSIAVVCVGGGSGGAYDWASDGGGGAGLVWMNGISVTAGETFTCIVGLGRESESSHGQYGAGPTFINRDSDNKTLLYAGGAGYQNTGNSIANGQTFNGATVSGLDAWTWGNAGSGNGSLSGSGGGIYSSAGSSVSNGTSTSFHYGINPSYQVTGSREGGGAGGYRGAVSSGGAGVHGQFGGGGMGYAYSSTHGEGAGGGVGLDGQGKFGAQAQTGVPRLNTQSGSGEGGNSSVNNNNAYNQGSPDYRGGAGGGSGGSRGAYGENPHSGREENNAGDKSRNGGMHGAGGGGSGTTSGGGNGAPGGMRIIWGAGADGTARSFPYTYCTENPSMKYTGE